MHQGLVELPVLTLCTPGRGQWHSRCGTSGTLYMDGTKRGHIRTCVGAPCQPDEAKPCGPLTVVSL